MTKSVEDEEGVLTISVEIELGWSLARTDKLGNVSQGRRAETAALDHLLTLCETHDVPITFDVVGHLMLDGCDGDHDGPHEDGWFDIDPCSDGTEDPLFYAPDLVAKIQDSTVDHELATHTFSHVLLDQVNPDVATWELARSRELHEAHGRAPVSLVTPRHRPCDPEVATRAGIRIVRMPSDARPTDGRGDTRMGRIARYFGPAPLIEPAIESGLVYSYCSRYPSLAAPFLPSGHAQLPTSVAAIPAVLRERLHRRRLLRTVSNLAGSGSATHLWCHLFDLSPACQRRPLNGFFEALDRHRDHGRISVLTMQRLNDRVRERASHT